MIYVFQRFFIFFNNQKRNGHPVWVYFLSCSTYFEMYLFNFFVICSSSRFKPVGICVISGLCAVFFLLSNTLDLIMEFVFVYVLLFYNVQCFFYHNKPNEEMRDRKRIVFFSSEIHVSVLIQKWIISPFYPLYMKIVILTPKTIM